MFVLCKFTDTLLSKQAGLLAMQTADTKESSPARFLLPRVHRNDEVAFGRWHLVWKQRLSEFHRALGLVW